MLILTQEALKGLWISNIFSYWGGLINKVLEKQERDKILMCIYYMKTKS